MTATARNLILAIVLLLTLAANRALVRDASQPNAQSILPNMAYPVSAESYAPSAVLPGGRVSQPAMPGTVAWGEPLLPFGPTPEEGDRAGLELFSPLDPADPDVLQRGALVYASKCVHCHGPGGEADGMVVMRGYPPPKSFLLEEMMLVPDGRMFHSITFGRGNMAPHGAIVAPDDRWRVIAYIRSLQQQALTAAAAAAAAETQPIVEPGADPAAPAVADPLAGSTPVAPEEAAP